MILQGASYTIAALVSNSSKITTKFSIILVDSRVASYKYSCTYSWDVAKLWCAFDFLTKNKYKKSTNTKFRSKRG